MFVVRGGCRLGTAALAILGALASPTPGQTWINEAGKMAASDAAPADWFGHAVAVRGDVAAVGARNVVCDAGQSCGAAYVFRYSGGAWVEAQKLVAPDPTPFGVFGFAVAADTDVVLVGGRAQGCCGAAYVFRDGGGVWSLEQTLAASDAGALDDFGVAVAVRNGVALVGARFHEGHGAAYVFRFDGQDWVEEQKLVAPDAAPDDEFGWTVGLDGDVAVIGAAGADCEAGPQCGAAYVFRWDGETWAFEQKLVAADAALDDQFGYSVSVSGDAIAVGALFDQCDTGGDLCGAAYVFRYTGEGWVQEQKLVPTELVEHDYYGHSVSINGDTAVAGAIYDDCDVGMACGAAYVFHFDGATWNESHKLTPSEPSGFDLFGYSVSVDEGVAFVSAILDDGACPADPECNSGAAYAFATRIAASYPPFGAIDARQPCAPDGSEPAGWNSVSMALEPFAGEVLPEDFALVCRPTTTAPDAIDVTYDGQVATVQFDDRIPTGAWTTISHQPSGFATRVGYLPSDVNNDRAGTANDVLALVDALNGVGDPLPANQADINRSGVSNASDILRTIDLLNGAAAYDPYLGATLPD